MPKNSVRSFSPGGISSFFQICDTTPEGKPIADLERIGARGGGFVIEKGVHTRVEISPAEKTKIEIFINKQLAPEAQTSRIVAEILVNKAGTPKEVTIEHDIDLPISAGFGTSAGGAISTALAISQALGMRFTYNQLGRIAHVAEIKCKTGLGTVGPIMLGGCILTVEPGGPGIGIIDRLPINKNYSIVAATIGPTATYHVLSSPEKRARINRWGKQTVDLILEEPSLENFLRRSLEFAEKTGFITERIRNLARIAERAGAIGVAQNMVGEAVHAVTHERDAPILIEAFKKVLPKENVLESKIDFQGARLI